MTYATFCKYVPILEVDEPPAVPLSRGRSRSYPPPLVFASVGAKGCGGNTKARVSGGISSGRSCRGSARPTRRSSITCKRTGTDKHMPASPARSNRKKAALFGGTFVQTVTRAPRPKDTKAAKLGVSSKAYFTSSRLANAVRF